MNPSGSFSRVVAWTLGASVVLAGAGCANLFVAKHKVLVDAISAPGAIKPTGKSYRLLAKKSVVSQGAVQIPVVKACVDAALAGQGMYEPPANVAPDFFIEVGYGTDTSSRLDPTARETYLQLSARENADGGIERGTGPEVWDVRVAVLGLAGRAESAMPMLSAVAASYLATDTHLETKIEIPKNSPMIAAVRETAIKSLETKGEMAANNAPAASTPAGSSAPAEPAPPPGATASATPAPGATPK